MPTPTPKPDFAAIVEQRIKAEWHIPENILSVQMEMLRNKIRNELILEWARKNPKAIEALCEGNAGVWKLCKHTDLDGKVTIQPCSERLDNQGAEE